MLNVRFEGKTAYGFISDAVAVLTKGDPGYVNCSRFGFLTGSDVRVEADSDEGVILVNGVHVPKQRAVARWAVYDEAVMDQAMHLADVGNLAGLVIYRPGDTMLVESDDEKMAREDFAEQGWPAWSLMVKKDLDFAVNI